MAYDIGDQIRLKATFNNPSGVPTAPTDIYVKIRTPAGVKTTYHYGDAPPNDQIKKETTGAYYIDVSITASGYWTYRWEGTGTIVAAEEAQYQVKVSKF